MKGPKAKVSSGWLEKNEVYSLHEGIVDGNELYAKVFNFDALERYGLTEAIEYNNCVFENCQDYAFPEHLLEIKHTLPHSNGVVFFTEKYETRLDLFLPTALLTEKQAIQIMEQILKALYSLYKAGYWSYNVRAEHFVLVNNKWKLTSLVFQWENPHQQIKSEYLFNQNYQVPQAYGNMREFSEKQVDEWISWDIGCLLINILMGNHKLKNQKMIDRFRHEPFSFEKIGAKISDRFSTELKGLLGKMCHYNPGERIKLSEIMRSGFFSKEISALMAKNKSAPCEQLHRKIYVPGTSSVSKIILHEQPLKKEKSTLINPKFTENMMPKIAEEEEDQSSVCNLNLNKIHNPKYSSVINAYKNYLNKCNILSFCIDGYNKLLLEKYELGLYALTQYSLKFVKAMFLCEIFEAMREKKQFFQKDRSEKEFIHSAEYEKMRKLVQKMKKQSLEEVAASDKKRRNFSQNISEKFCQSDTQQIEDFLENFRPQNCTFNQIKSQYRTIMKKSYDMMVTHYTENKSNQWARAGMQITYCMAIDKLYMNKKRIPDNFKHYFNFLNLEPCQFIDFTKFKNYLLTAPKQILIHHSREIVEKFYKL